jgi:uncharacterized cupredoxin-like copper-binding protein
MLLSLMTVEQTVAPGQTATITLRCGLARSSFIAPSGHEAAGMTGTFTVTP